MIIDRVALAGASAYLRENEQVNLVSSPNHVGESMRIYRGMGLNVSAIDLLLHAEDLTQLYQRDEKTLFSITLSKEMFPRLFADPYRRCAHSIAGAEDFNRGAAHGMRVMEVGGVSTLVSIGSGDVNWTSPIYRLAEPKGARFVDAAWDISTSRLTPDDAFRYTLRIEYWDVNQDVETDSPALEPLAEDAKPGDPRFRSGFEIKNVIAYRILFKAIVIRETDLNEFDVGAPIAETIGRPLLRSVNVLESIDSKHDYHSLHELEVGSIDSRVFEQPSPPRLMLARVDFPAYVNVDESISIQLHLPDRFKRFEARLDAELESRAPLTDKSLEP